MTQRVLVTGATGFIGHHTLAPLVARGYEVHALSSRPDTARRTRRPARLSVWHQAI
ncbi:MAG: NAD-dependent epimerase/dehydratase family protein [Myxococcota bacterium]